jgi:hypothetical protein
LTPSAENSLRKRIVTVVSHLLCGLGLLPVLVYVVGEAVVGPYEGIAGLASFLGSIYGDLLRFKPGAWILVTTPSLIVGVWYGSTELQRHLLRGASDETPDSS